MRESGKVFLLGLLLCGLCLRAQANTTTAGVPPAADALPPGAAPVRVALLLPLRSETLGRAADALRAGFLAAYAREKDGIEVTLIETDDAAPEVLAGYAEAVAHHDIVVGPLSRSGVALVAQSDAVRKPTIALTQPDAAGETELVLPPQMLVVSLSVEDEARQIANWAMADQKTNKALVLSTAVAWQRRAAKAFVTQWQRLGQEPQTMELAAAGGYLSANGLAQLRKRIQADKPGLLFVALDAAQARQVRTAIGNDIALYGTSQLNPQALSEWEWSERAPEMNGARLLDIPWQLQADHPAVMIYPHQAGGAEQKRSADLERLYALGIDAYRIAREIAARRASFELDGVTGKLKVSFGQGAARFERIEQAAIYQGGAVVPLGAER